MCSWLLKYTPSEFFRAHVIAIFYFSRPLCVKYGKYFWTYFWNTVKRKDVFWYKLIAIVLIYERSIEIIVSFSEPCR